LNTLGQIGPNCAFGADPENGVFDKANCSTFGYVDPLKKFEASNSYIGRQDRNGTSLLLRGEFDLGGVELTSITGYMDGSQTLGTDTDGTPIRLGEKIRHYKVEALSTELRFTDTSRDGFFWMAGSYLSTDKNSLVDDAEFTRSLGFLRNTNIPGFDWSSTRVLANQKTNTWAVFAHTETELTDRLKLIAGARYSYVDKTFTNSTNAIYSQADAAAIQAMFGPQVLDGRVPNSALANIDGSGPGVIDDRRKDKRLTWKLGLDWKITTDTLLYASYSRGFREGGFEGNFVLSANNATGYSDETLDAFEIGWKSELLDRTLRLNGAVYYYKYTDAQQRTTAINPNNNIPANFIANIGNARQYGIDLDAVWVASNFLTIDAGISWLDQSIKANSNVLQIEDGEVFPYASKFSGTLNANVRVPVGSNVDFKLQGGLKYASGFETTAENLRALRDNGYTLVNARIGISDPDDKWQVSVFGNNLTNQFFITQTYALFASYVIGGNTPRTYGISFDYKF
jgi:iron complex outermembrane recepter protein